MKRSYFTHMLTVAAVVSALLLVHGQQQSNSDLNGPTALAFDRSGNLFVASYPNTIIKFSADGTKSTFATGVFGDDGLLFDKAGNLFVLDGDFDSIAKFTPDGTKSSFATGIRNSQGLTCDRVGNLFVSEVGSESILRYTPDGTKSTFANGISVPRSMAFDGSGNLFVYDAMVNSIFKISHDGTKTEFRAGISASSLIFDKAGDLFVGDMQSKSVIKFASDGSKTTFAAGIDGPAGLAFDKAGNLFVSEQTTNSILKFPPDGTRTVFYKAAPQASAAEEEQKDSSTGLPAKYAKNYLIASQTISPNKRFAVIYPKFSEEVADTANTSKNKDYVVTLQPFAVLHALDTKWAYFEHESNGGLSAEWSDDSSVALITLDSKWGPQDVFLVEFHNDKLSRMTNILRKAHDLLLPSYRKAKAERYNDYFDFIFIEDATFKLEDTRRVLVDAEADTTPNDLGLSPRAWHGRVEATWDIAQAKFTSQKVSGQKRRKREDAPD